MGPIFRIRGNHISYSEIPQSPYFTATDISAFYHRFVGAPTTGTALVSSKVGLRYHRATVAVVISQFVAVIIIVPGLFLVDIS